MKAFAIRVTAVAAVVFASVASAAVPSAASRDDAFWFQQLDRASIVQSVQQGAMTAQQGRNALGMLSAKEPGIQAGSLVDRVDVDAARSTAALRDKILTVSAALAATMEKMLACSGADPSLPGSLASLEVDQQRLRQFYERLNFSPVGASPAPKGTKALDRVRMSEYLGFKAPVPAFPDVARLRFVDASIELSGIVAGVSVHVGSALKALKPETLKSDLSIATRRASDSLRSTALSMLRRSASETSVGASWGICTDLQGLLAQFDKCLKALPQKAPMASDPLLVEVKDRVADDVSWARVNTKKIEDAIERLDKDIAKLQPAAKAK